MLCILSIIIYAMKQILYYFIFNLMFSNGFYRNLQDLQGIQEWVAYTILLKIITGSYSIIDDFLFLEGTLNKAQENLTSFQNICSYIRSAKTYIRVNKTFGPN